MKLVSNFGVFTLDGVRIFSQGILIDVLRPSTISGVFYDGAAMPPVSRYDICYIIRYADAVPFVEFMEEK